MACFSSPNPHNGQTVKLSNLQTSLCRRRESPQLPLVVRDKLLLPQLSLNIYTSTHHHVYSAEGGSRTRTPFRIHAPETCASTSFAIPAILSKMRIKVNCRDGGSTSYLKDKRKMCIRHPGENYLYFLFRLIRAECPRGYRRK